MKSFLSFYRVASGNWTQVYKLGSKRLYILTYWAISTTNLSTQPYLAHPSPGSSLVTLWILPSMFPFKLPYLCLLIVGSGCTWAYFPVSVWLHPTEAISSLLASPARKPPSTPIHSVCIRHWTNTRSLHAQISSQKHRQYEKSSQHLSYNLEIFDSDNYLDDSQLTEFKRIIITFIRELKEAKEDTKKKLNELKEKEGKEKKNAYVKPKKIHTYGWQKWQRWSRIWKQSSINQKMEKNSSWNQNSIENPTNPTDSLKKSLPRRMNHVEDRTPRLGALDKEARNIK